MSDVWSHCSGVEAEGVGYNNNDVGSTNLQQLSRYKLHYTHYKVLLLHLFIHF